jgi:RecA/RadA recombinase|tara:strand:- start:10976 stop:12088 length:1113 start_codon:yes stop_codon:yes gene_type:complete
MAKKKTQQVEAALVAQAPKRREVIPDSDLLKTGSTMLDLAITGRRSGGFAKGKYFWIVGDSSSGKTFLTLTCLAEASIDPAFNNYRFIYDNGEDGALMDMAHYFGPGMASRLESPGVGEKGHEVHSDTIEDFYYHLDDALAGGQPFIYILDSMDALDSTYSARKFNDAKTASRKGTKAKGDYGDGKAKINSTRIRHVVRQLRDSGSILIVLSQTRDNIDAGMFEEQQTHAGGRALKFYATVQLWSSVGKRIKKTINDREVVVGVTCRVKTKKNRFTGRERVVEFPIYFATGIDDIGGMIDYLTTWKVWPKTGGKVDASKHFDGVAMRRADLITWVEENDVRADLEEVCEEAWQGIEARLTTARKSKYEVQ